MKITIIDGSLANDTEQEYPDQLKESLRTNGHEVSLIKTRDLTIEYCLGCWICWWKTPGKCVHTDDMEKIYRSYTSSDLVLHYSPMKAGFISSRLKNVNDRSVPLVLPYVELDRGECHHKKRYDHYPMLGLIVDKNGHDDEELEITKQLYQRMSINFKSDLKIFTTTTASLEAINHEIRIL